MQQEETFTVWVIACRIQHPQAQSLKVQDKVLDKLASLRIITVSIDGTALKRIRIVLHTLLDTHQPSKELIVPVDLRIC